MSFESDFETPACEDICRRGGRWFVGYTVPRKEKLAQSHLERQGFETFLPCVLSTWRHAHKSQTLKVPLFPRYLFIHLDLTRDQWRSVNGTVGMAYLVTARETPCPVPVGFVEALRQSAGYDGVINFVSELKPGDPVRITAGAFAGQIGEVLSLNAKGRVELLLALLNGAVRLNVARKLLETAN